MEKRGHLKLLTGNEAVARGAYEAGVRVATAYPGTPSTEILENISIILKDKCLKIATAESCTGGLISHTFTNISGSSEFFDRGIVSYSNNAKIQLLDVSEDIFSDNTEEQTP